MGEDKKGLVEKIADKITGDDTAAAGLAGEQQEGNFEDTQSSQSAERG